MTVNFKLRTPVEHAGTTYQDLTFREPLTVDMMAADKFEGQDTKIIVTLASMSGVPLPAFQKITRRDLLKMIEAVAPLLGEEEEAAGEA